MPLAYKGQGRTLNVPRSVPSPLIPYEAKHHAIYPPDPVDAIKFRMDQLGMTRKDLETVLGGRGRVSEILTKKRNLSLEMIRRLHRKWHIPLESLIGTAA
jgi:HTH-type transcriptional regulator/antitoxin HigA